MTDLTSAEDDGPSMEDRRRAAGEQAGGLDAPVLAFLVLWSAFFIPVTAIFLWKMTRQVA